MSSPRQRTFVDWLVGLACFGLAMLSLLAPRLRAQESPPPSPPTGSPGEPFQLFEAGPGEITYDQLSLTPASPPTAEEIAAGFMTDSRYQEVTKETRASVDDTADWADGMNGAPVHEAWSGYTAVMQVQAEAARAAYEAGLSGSENIGVSP
jgi:hypothetical protein